MEIWSALLAAAVGGSIDGLVAWLQTPAPIRHESDRRTALIGGHDQARRIAKFSTARLTRWRPAA